MGTASGIRTRRYHSLLTVATTPPTSRVVLVAGVEAWLLEEDGKPQVALSSQRYAPNVVHPAGHERIISFEVEPWPTWAYRVDDAHSVRHEVVCHRPSGEVSLSWRLLGDSARTLVLRPLLAVRDYHALTHENADFRFDAKVVGGNVSWHPYVNRPAVTALTTGRYRHDPQWYRQFRYVQEQARGLDHLEDLASPGYFEFRLEAGESADMVLRPGHAPYGDASAIVADQRQSERARRSSALERAVDAYLVRRGGGLTVVAGYPWFTDWGRDTFISLRGLCLATGRGDARADQGRQVLCAWATEVTDGMVPNRFTDADTAPELNAVDASLWFVIAAGEALDRGHLSISEHELLRSAVLAVVAAYRRGARYGIQCGDDGLIAAGQPGIQLTWMDAKVDGRVITPRIGKPVEIQALWVNALIVAERFKPLLSKLRELATASFAARFIRDSGALYDVVDADHVAGRDDASFRPNQIFAVGGLPHSLLEGESARRVVDQVEERLWTPCGLRSLDPADVRYRAHYEGDVVERDESYHQGTVWPWLAGAFVEAWLRVRGSDAAARAEARRRFYEPMVKQLCAAGLGHVSEIADGDAPHTLRGAPFQAWSLAELLRIRSLLGGTD